MYASDEPINLSKPLVNELLELSKRRGGRYVHQSTAMWFNNDYYGINPGSKEYVSLIIDWDENDELGAYIPTYRQFQKLIAFTDKEKANEIMNKLYYLPCYHSSTMYVEQITSLWKTYDINKYKSLPELESDLLRIYKEALRIQNQMEDAAGTFGSAHRFLITKHRVQKLLNLYTSTFEKRYNKFIKKDKYIYDGVWKEGEYIHYYEEKCLSSDDFTIDDRTIFGPTFDSIASGGGFLVEAHILDAINKSFDDVPDNLNQLIKLFNQLLEHRGWFKSKEQRKAYVAALVAVQDEPNKLRDTFNKLFVESMEAAGVKVKREPFYDLPTAFK